MTIGTRREGATALPVNELTRWKEYPGFTKHLLTICRLAFEGGRTIIVEVKRDGRQVIFKEITRWKGYRDFLKDDFFKECEEAFDRKERQTIQVEISFVGPSKSSG